MMKKKVSVNITTYNRANLLSRCISSVINQSYFELEIIIVDDCSNDDTKNVVKEFQKKDKRIKYFRHDFNKGNAYARNTALENCTGYYVAFMDDDDEWIDFDKIKKQVYFFENTKDSNLGIICTGVRRFRDENTSFDKVYKKPDNLIYRILIGNSIIFNSTVMTKRSIMIEVGGFDTELPVGIDADFFRNCIVKYGYDVHFMDAITTGVHEYGHRMTPIYNLSSLKKNISGIEMRLNKYSESFKLNSDAKRYRKKDLFKKHIKLLIKEPRWINLTRMIKGMRI